MPLRETIDIHAASAAPKQAVFTANHPNGPPDGGSNQSDSMNSNNKNSGNFNAYSLFPFNFNHLLNIYFIFTGKLSPHSCSVQ